MTTIADPAAPTTPTVRHVLRIPRMRRLLGALAVSQAGDWLYNLALVALVLDRTHSATWVAVTTAARVAPVVIGGPFGGVVADRFDRRTLMIASDVARAACMVGLAVVAATGLPVVLVPVLAALATVASTPYPPAVAATTPRLVPSELLVPANAARSAIGSLCIVVGPALGAVLLLVGSPAVAFALNAGTFLLSAGLVASIPGGAAFAVPAERERVGGVAREIADAAGELRRQPVALRLVGADVLCSALYGAHTVLLLLLAHELGLGASGYGYLLAAAGLGGVVGTALAGRLVGALAPRRLLLGACWVVAVPGVLLGVSTPLPLLLLWSALIGAGSLVVEVGSDTCLQQSVPEEVLGRVYGIAYPAAVSGIVLGSVVAAPLASVLGVPGALVTMGGAMAAYALVLVLTGRGDRRPAAALREIVGA